MAEAVVRATKRFLANDPQGVYEQIVFEAARTLLVAFGRAVRSA